ncbi:MAG: recombinase family protein [Euryarchaeota archaeon]|nr:recombinase family protein [Euryarchaeota archaeon]
MRAAVYARVSTDDQARDGFSIAAQQKRMAAYCKARGWQVAGEYTDEGFSGRNTKRPAYQRMMTEKDQWDVLLVLKMDRIHRNSTNFTLMMDDLQRWGKEFNSMQESFDTTTAMGRFVMDIIQRIAQLESEQIGERVKVGMVQKAKSGKGVLGSGVPFGYRYHNRHLVKVEEEAAIVEDIFSQYLACVSLNDIANDLNSRNIPTKMSLTWEKSTVRNVLTNKLHIGILEWDGIQQAMPELVIISNDDFNDVQQLLSDRKRNNCVARAKREKGEVHA